MNEEVLTVKDYFTYHKCQTEERVEKHEDVNAAILDVAELLDHTIRDQDCKTMALFALQQCRMFAHQGITVDEVKKLRQNELD